MSSEEFAHSRRSTVRRLPERGRYDRTTVHAILDEALVCDVAFVVDGRPVVIPMSFGREGDRLFLHGSVGSRLQRTLADGADVCVSVTLLDALVLARSLFHHSMNYRSVVLFGRTKGVAEGEKMEALRVISEHIAPGRWDEARRPNDREFNGTSVLEVIVQEASAKIRSGPPKDDEEDLELKVWAGEIRLALTPVAAVPDPALRIEAAAPPLERFHRRR